MAHRSTTPPARSDSSCAGLAQSGPAKPVVLCVFGGLALLLGSCTDPRSCATDDECPGAKTCKSGRCVGSTAPRDDGDSDPVVDTSAETGHEETDTGDSGRTDERDGGDTRSDGERGDGDSDPRRACSGSAFDGECAASRPCDDSNDGSAILGCQPPHENLEYESKSYCFCGLEYEDPPEEFTVLYNSLLCEADQAPERLVVRVRFFGCNTREIEAIDMTIDDGGSSDPEEAGPCPTEFSPSGEFRCDWFPEEGFVDIHWRVDRPEAKPRLQIYLGAEPGISYRYRWETRVPR